jgi:hypothetical protein
MTKAELEQEIKILRQYVVNLKEDNKLLATKVHMIEGQARNMSNIIQTLEEELNMRRAQETLYKNFNDDSRNY